MVIQNICTSGGAIGSDLEWGQKASYNNMTVIHFSFKGHKITANKDDIYILNEDELNEANEPCKMASISIKKYFPPKSEYVKNLLRRNWYQIENAVSCYAVIKSLKDKTLAGVDGGTSWATAMFVNKYNNKECSCYVFDQDDAQWYKWKQEWVPIYEPPKPTGVWAGIGTRDINSIGKLAITVLMDYKMNYHSSDYPLFLMKTN